MIKTLPAVAALTTRLWPWPGATPVLADPTDLWCLPLLLLGAGAALNAP